MIHLSMGQCYVQDALKRQSENRQYFLTQGFVFLQKYYEQRMKSSSVALRQEAHYNMGRSYHGLGLHHLAIEYYQRALQEVPRDEDTGAPDGNDLTLETVFNLQQICLVSGDVETVRWLTETYMVI
jgi:general transcription factor 3C polypeptide 3 (transcription factor C subunit 4)